MVTIVGHKNFYNFELYINYDADFYYPPMHRLRSRVYTLIICGDFFGCMTLTQMHSYTPLIHRGLDDLVHITPTNN